MEYLKKFRSILRKIFAAAKDNNFCKESPVTSTLRTHSAQPFTPEKRVWNEAQYITAWNFAKQHKHGLVIKTLMETGMSRSEVLGLQCKDYDGEAKLLYIEQGLAECNMDNGRELLCSTLKNAHRHRMIPIFSELNAYFALLKSALRAKRGKMPLHIFCRPDGNPYWPTAWYSQTFCRFMADLHMEYLDIPALQTHELRHTRATLLSLANVNLFSIANLLGHRNLEMLSKRYLHSSIDTLRQSLHIL